MVVDIKMCRFENVPWGFRLVGGADFDYPLTVVKVTEGSIAEEAGLRVDDIIVRINDTPTSPLTHEEANKMIKHCGNVFYFGVQRENEEADIAPKQFPILGLERPTTPLGFLDVNNTMRQSPEDFYSNEYLPDLADRPSSVLSENTEIKLVEEEIAAVLSGETEVLSEHNVLGIFPKPGVCMSSDVLRTLNEEAIKTKAEKDKENKKWTTFLQKPNRPIPKSKAQIEAERRAANAYKVKIVKSAPRTPERAISPAPPTVEPTPAAKAEVEKQEEMQNSGEKEPTPAEPEVEEPAPTDSEVPNLEQVKIVIETAADEAEEAEKSDVSKETEAEEESKTAEETAEQASETVASNEAETAEAEAAIEATVEKTEEELALERQLADVQRQLAALSSLPSTIQSTLDAVTKQLAILLPTFKLQQTQQPASTETEVRSISLEKIDEGSEVANKETAEVDNDNTEAITEQQQLQTEEQSVVEEAQSTNEQQAEVLDPIKQLEGQQRKEETRQMEAEQSIKKQKRHDVIEELEEHLERNKTNAKRSKRAFGPLTPSSERPLVLPGGRRWYRPKDAYNDEFIAETLSAQAELITGTTLGVNFMKYQKPEKKIDLNRSEVYKVIHHLDRQPVRGIEVRPPVVPAEVDIRKTVHS